MACRGRAPPTVLLPTLLSPDKQARTGARERGRCRAARRPPPRPGPTSLPPSEPGSPLPSTLSTILAGPSPVAPSAVSVLPVAPEVCCCFGARTPARPGASRGDSGPRRANELRGHPGVIPAPPGTGTSNTLFLPQRAHGRQRLNSSAPGQTGKSGSQGPAPPPQPGVGGDDVWGSRPCRHRGLAQPFLPWGLPGHSTRHILTSLRQCWGPPTPADPRPGPTAPCPALPDPPLQGQVLSRL